MKKLVLTTMFAFAISIVLSTVMAQMPDLLPIGDEDKLNNVAVTAGPLTLEIEMSWPSPLASEGNRETYKEKDLTFTSYEEFEKYLSKKEWELVVKIRKTNPDPYSKIRLKIRAYYFESHIVDDKLNSLQLAYQPLYDAISIDIEIDLIYLVNDFSFKAHNKKGVRQAIIPLLNLQSCKLIVSRFLQLELSKETKTQILLPQKFK